jgi:ADP-heptose:LPS heptosyltransferase
MLHLADLYQVPGVGLFGPTDPSEFGFRFARHLHVRAATMNEISVADVGHALEALWNSVFPDH